MTDRRTRTSVRAISAALAMVMLAACGGSGSKSGTSSASADAARPQWRTLSTDELRYGPAPDEHAPITYQPDVVFVKGGPSVIRSVSDDGLTWTIRGDAPGIDKVKIGQVLFVTSKALGRVFEMKKVGSDVEVGLGPVQLTDVVRDGHLKLSQPLDLETALASQYGDPDDFVSTPGESTELSSQTEQPTVTLTPLGPRAGATPARVQLASSSRRRARPWLGPPTTRWPAVRAQSRSARWTWASVPGPTG